MIRRAYPAPSPILAALLAALGVSTRNDASALGVSTRNDASAPQFDFWCDGVRVTLTHNGVPGSPTYERAHQIAYSYLSDRRTLSPFLVETPACLPAHPPTATSEEP